MWKRRQHFHNRWYSQGIWNDDPAEPGIGSGANGNCTFAGNHNRRYCRSVKRNGRKRELTAVSNGSAKTLITGGSIKGPVSGSPTDGNGNYMYIRQYWKTNPELLQ